MSAQVLYIAYDGLMEPLGQSQVLQYLKLLGKKHSITLVTYEKPDDLSDPKSFRHLQAEVKQAGIDWRPLTYHKRPSALATAYDLLVGFLLGSWLVLRKRIGIVHARSYVPSVIALGLKKLFGVKFVFDMRGFWADERVDGGLWPKGSRLYRVARWFEHRFLLNADTVVSLTRAGVEEMRKFPYLQESALRFDVIPTCTNLELFYPRPGKTAEPRPFTLGYVGSVGTWYLLDEMIECFKILREHRPDARMLFINRNEHDLIRQRLVALSVSADCVEIRAVHYSEVVGQMHRMDAGILFIKPVFSKKASAPTKLGEFLACGIPCLGNAGVGDVEAVLEGERVGVVVSEFSRTAMERAVLELLELYADEGISIACRGVAERTFSLAQGVDNYDRIYRSLA